MNVGILIITHGNIGAILLQTAIHVLGMCPLSTKTLSAPPDCNSDKVFNDAILATEELDSGDGVLILTDMYGATPSNIACRLVNSQDIRIVSGINLPMLIRALNYPNLSLDKLTEKAVSGGRDGVQTCQQEITKNAHN
ncbi:MAG: PTS sugar transporter subunit IIA [Gammaproteobacteria bacterium]